MEILSNYEKYAREALANFSSKDTASRYLLVDAVKDLEVESVLDVGCGAGQELLPFIERTTALCVGIDSAEKLGQVMRMLSAATERLVFARSKGEKLPFAAASFDVVLCRIALPYMNNRETLAEISRVLKPNGILLLKTHAPLFYFGMIWEGLKNFSAKRVAYPLICLAASLWHLLTGKQLQNGFWQGKEIFQTQSFLVREFAKNDLQIDGSLSDHNRQTPSFIVIKMALIKLFLVVHIFSNYDFVV